MAIGKMSGQAWVFGDIMDVDHEICPLRTLMAAVAAGLPFTPEELGKYCMIEVDPDFPKKVKKGDFIVAGENLGYGHDHANACISIVGAGVAAAICNSTNSNFFRNSIHCGLPVVEIPGIRQETREGDALELDLAAGTLKNLTKGSEYSFVPFPAELLDILEAGSQVAYLEQELEAGRL